MSKVRLLSGEDSDYPAVTTAEIAGDAAALVGFRLWPKLDGKKSAAVVLTAGADDAETRTTISAAETKNAYRVLNAESLALAQQVSEHYFTPLADVLKQMLPPVLARLPKTKGAPEKMAQPAAAPLSERQQKIADTINTTLTDAVREHLIWGVTGSGKTRIYEHLIAAALERGEQALLLVPEIALSGQLMEVITARFPGQTVLYHSGLSAGERLLNYSAFLAGQAAIAIGTRSAVFLPAKKLGLILIDEEHDASFKDQRQMRFDTRTVARMRLAAAEKPLLVLGSATPSLDALSRARAGNATLHRLRERATGQNLPEVFVPDYKMQYGIIAPFLQAKMREHLSQGKQVLLLMNRRGHSTHVHCPTCDGYAECQRCAVALTYHKDNMLRCHHCGYSERYTPECPKDGAERRLSGRGIQRVEEILDHQFAEYEYARLDRDTAKQKNFVAEVLAAMRERKIQILIGTQMIAKGFDLAGVTLVGVLAIDQTLNSPDFRASEQAWQLLAQVVGRSGRHEPGEVVIQTMSPHHPAIIAAQTHEADQFYAAEAEFRRATGYPPFGALARIVLFSRDENKLFSQAEKLARDIAPENLKTLFNESGQSGVELLGPALPGLKKADDEYRVHFLIKAKTEALLRAYLVQINGMLERTRRLYSELRIVLDIDPRDVS